ncbi:MAG: Ig-like domain-containing protein, partial [Leptospiraceae bacterium]|nr:Ig-like domain-containing protein [Leptospiraceae bacterium]
MKKNKLKKIKDYLKIFLFGITFFTFCKGEKLFNIQKTLPMFTGEKSPSIIAFSPGKEELNVSPDSKIQIIFNKFMNLDKCKEAFSISPPLEGRFVTSPNSLEFIPSQRFASKYYTYRINKNCEDMEGIDLENVFSSSFTVSENMNTPKVASILVSGGDDNTCNSNLGETLNIINYSPVNICANSKIQITFTHKMDTERTLSKIYFTPSINYNHSWNDNTILTIIPDGNLSRGQKYNIIFDKEIRSIEGLNMSASQTSSFTVNSESLPTINSIKAFSGSLIDCKENRFIEVELLNQDIINICNGTSLNNSIRVYFSEEMDTSSLIGNISFFPNYNNSFIWTDSNRTLIIKGDEEFLIDKRYIITFYQGIKSSSGKNLKNNYQVSFKAGGEISNPEVQAFGIASQNCPDSFPGIGSGSGGDWNLNSCFWDKEKAILSPSNYLFRSGDDGSGSYNSNLSCSDINTDNFKVIFDSYMDTLSVISSVKLYRNSPPTTNIKLTNWLM